MVNRSGDPRRVLACALLAACVACTGQDDGKGAPGAVGASATAGAATSPSIASSQPAAGAGAPAELIPGAATAEAAKLYNTRCMLCHGPQGRGDGPSAMAYNPRPANFTDPAWQQGTSDKDIETAILSGGAAVGKSNLMPPNPDLANLPDVVRALRAKVRAFAGR